MERTITVSRPIEIRKSRTCLETFNSESVLSFSEQIKLNGINMRLQRLGDRHYIAAFTSAEFTKPMVQKLKHGHQYETSDGAFVFRGTPIVSGARRYLFLEFNLI